MNTSSTSYFRKALPTFFLLAASLALSSATMSRAATVSNWLALTITNPTPAVGDNFGVSVAAVGTGRVLIGAPQDNTGASGAGAAYLFNTNGALLTAFTNPTPAVGDRFGLSLAAVGTDQVLIGAPYDNTGAYGAGAAYLFDTNGVLITTFTNPTPALIDYFGWSVAGMGADRVLIGALNADAGVTNGGAVYLFSTSGTLLAVVTSPTLASGDYFGSSVAAVGTDWMLIGAHLNDTGASEAGAAYLFSTNGTLLTTFANPTPVFFDWFGYSVAAVGSDRVLIAAYRKDTGAIDAGAAYLFSTNGALLITFTNPTPAVGDWFGYSVAAVGSDRVLIAAYHDDTGASDAGAAYLFSTNGTMLTTFTNPTPADAELFGYSVAAVGTDRVLIGSRYDSTGGSGAGAAYLFNLEPFTPRAPLLSTSRSPSLSTFTVSWPAPAAGWLLERTNALPSVAVSSWPPVPPPYQTNAGTISVTFTNLPATGNQFFRLRQP